jgi:hypothetical protein
MRDFLGKECKDIITGFKGIAVGHVEYLTGCDQILLVPKAGKDNAHRESIWIDQQRIKILNDSVIKLNNAETPGADLAAPIK